MKISEETIPLIEKALNIELYEAQKRFLLNKAPFGFDGRGTGRTLAHCIRLALMDRCDYIVPGKFGYSDYILVKGTDPIDTRNMKWYSDYGDGSHRYANGFYRRMFLDIWHSLKEAGLPVKELRF